MVYVPVSVGELVDKLSILEVKSRMVRGGDKLRCVNEERRLLWPIAEQAGVTQRDALYLDLLRVNTALWHIEDGIRAHLARNDRGASFVELAEAVPRINDERSKIKARINDDAGSPLREVKEHVAY